METKNTNGQNGQATQLPQTSASTNQRLDGYGLPLQSEFYPRRIDAANIKTEADSRPPENAPTTTIIRMAGDVYIARTSKNRTILTAVGKTDMGGSGNRTKPPSNAPTGGNEGNDGAAAKKWIKTIGFAVVLGTLASVALAVWHPT